MSNDRLKFRARLGVSYYDDAGNDIEGVLVIDNVAVYHDGSVGFSEESLADAVDRLAKTDRENDTIWQYVEDNFSTESDLWYWAAGAIIEQCTGLKDKNGNLIYEGDLVYVPNSNNDPVKGVVKWDEECATFFVETLGNLVGSLGYYGTWHNRGITEIIGNIHEQQDQ